MKIGTVVSHLGIKVLIEDEHQQRVAVPVSRNSGHVVGDKVQFTHERMKRLPRRNFLARKTQKGSQALAANLDTVGIVTSVIPKTPRAFLDRALIAIFSQNLKPFIIVNKMDLKDSEEFLNHIQNTFQNACSVIPVSTRTQQGLKELREFLSHQGRSILIGVSGVGKSSLTNTLLPNSNLAVGELLDKTSHGQHVTTVSNLFHLPNGGELIDTPGVRDFNPIDLDPLTLAHYFPDFQKILEKPCKFRDCLHTHEPGCLIQEAVTRGQIKKDRFETYLEILQTRAE